MTLLKRAQLEQAALRAAQKATDRKNGSALSREEWGNLRVQTVAFPVRFALTALGVLISGAGFWLVCTNSPFFGGALLLVGFFVLVAGIAGWKRSLDRLLTRYGDDVAKGIFELLS